MGHPNSVEHRGGRPKGSVNWQTKQVQTFCRSICEDPLYRQDLVERARSGRLGAMEPVIWAYGYGRPKESIDLHVGPLQPDLSELSVVELAELAESLGRQMREAADLQAALPAEYHTVLSVESSEQAETPAVSTQSSAVEAENPTEPSVDGQGTSDSAGSSAANEDTAC